MRMYEKEGEKYQYKEKHIEVKERQLLKKQIASERNGSLCLLSNGNDSFHSKNLIFHKSKGVQGTISRH